MKTLSTSAFNVEGGATFGYLVNKLFKENGFKKVKLAKTWNNKKTVFIVDNKQYVIGDSSYIFNYEGFLELEEFTGKTREINGTTIISSYSTALEAVPSKEELAYYGFHSLYYNSLEELIEAHRTMEIK
jgi:hypothetical protein